MLARQASSRSGALTRCTEIPVQPAKASVRTAAAQHSVVNLNVGRVMSLFPANERQTVYTPRQTFPQGTPAGRAGGVSPRREENLLGRGFLRGLTSPGSPR